MASGRPDADDAPVGAPEHLEREAAEIDYRTLSGAVIPRAIAWVSTRSTAGVDNLAPFSFFTVASIRPPILVFAPQDRGDRADGLKDTAANVRATGEFAVNVVSEPLASAMNETSITTLPRDESEFEHAGIDRAPCVRIDAPRVAASPVAFECTLAEFLDVGSASLVLGEVVYAHIAESVTTDGKLDVRKLDAVGRLAGSWYATLDARFSMERPP